MANIKKFDNIVEAIKYLEPNHILGTCLDREGVAVKHPNYESVIMPDGRIRMFYGIMEPDLKGSLQPIGVQPFARPDRQDGYGFWIPENEDFIEYSYYVEFTQNAAVNLRLKTAMMGGVDYLFPNEQISQMALIINNTSAITSMAIKAMLADIEAGRSYINPSVTRDDINQVIKEYNIFVVDAPVICPEAMPQRINAFMDERRLVVKPAYKKESH